jgi:hypothetical protein
MKFPVVWQFVFLVAASVLCMGQAQAAHTAPSPEQLLPGQFAGWQLAGTRMDSLDAATADPANSAVLKEYGFQLYERAEYTRDDGRRLQVKAVRFGDASGAYGAYTFYLTPAMLDEKIGDQAASLNDRVLFFRGNVLVDALFSKVSMMSAAELRELAGMLPQAAGNAGKLPTLRNYLPASGYEKNTARYITGPATLDRLNAPLGSAMVDFGAGAEVMVGRYSAAAGEATLMLIEYPTPQIAAKKLQELDAAHPATAQQPGVASIVDVGPFFDKRSGPLLVIASGPLSQSEARALLASISYEADVTWNQNTYLNKRDNLANLLFNVIVLCGIVIGLALVAGIGFGGVRILAKRLFPGRVFDRAEETEIIALHLGDRAREVSRGGK